MRKYLLITGFIGSSIFSTIQAEKDFIEPIPSDKPSAAQRIQIDKAASLDALPKK